MCTLRPRSSPCAQFIESWVISYLAAPRTNLGHGQGEKLPKSITIIAFFLLDPKLSRSLVTRLGSQVWSSASVGLKPFIFESEIHSLYFRKASTSSRATMIFAGKWLILSLLQNQTCVNITKILQIKKNNQNEWLLPFSPLPSWQPDTRSTKRRMKQDKLPCKIKVVLHQHQHPLNIICQI